jgi:hypothetical protein
MLLCGFIRESLKLLSEAIPAIRWLVGLKPRNEIARPHQGRNASPPSPAYARSATAAHG